MKTFDELAFSHSAIQEYMQCQYKFYGKRVAMLFKDPPFDASDYGNMLHKAFEMRIKNDTALPETLKRYDPMLAKLKARGETYAELEFCYNRQLQPTGWFDKDAWWRQKIDVVSLPAMDTAVMIDWKTGKRKFDTVQMALSAASAMMTLKKLDKVHTYYAWLKDDILDPAGTYTRDQLPAIWNEHVIIPIKSIKNSYDTNNWTPNPSKLCGWCGWKTCQYRQKGC